MPRDVEFLHELSIPNELDSYYQRLQIRSQARMAERDMWVEIERTLTWERRPQYLRLPPAQSILDFHIRGNHTRLFNTTIYMPDYMLTRIPAELQPRLESDSLLLELIDNNRHDVTETQSPLLCGLWQLRNATGSWSHIVYECIGCRIGETTNGNPTNTQN